MEVTGRIGLGDFASYLRKAPSISRAARRACAVPAHGAFRDGPAPKHADLPARHQQLPLQHKAYELPTAIVGGTAALMAMLHSTGQALADNMLPTGGGSIVTPSLLAVDLPAVPDASSLVASLGGTPTLLAGGAAALAFVGGAAAISGFAGGAIGGKVKGTTAEKTLEAMQAEPRVVLLDVRPKESVRELGSPDLKDVKRRLVTMPYTQVRGRPCRRFDRVQGGTGRAVRTELAQHRSRCLGLLAGCWIA